MLPQSSAKFTKKMEQTFGRHSDSTTFAAMTQKELLDRLESDLKDAMDIVRSSLSGQSADILKQRPSPESWNALECFAHLNVFLERYIPVIERAVHLGRARRWSPSGQVNYTIKGRSVIGKTSRSNARPGKTPKRYNFIHQPVAPEVVKSFLINSERLLRNIQAAKEVDLNRPRIGWGPSRFFRLTLGNMLEWLVEHSCRHVIQASKAATRT